MLRRFKWLAVTLTALFGMLFALPQSFAETLPKIDIVVFTPPSLGAFLPPVIKSQKLDAKNGIDINFVQRTPSAYIAQFNSGEFQLGGSAALLSIATASNRGVKAVYLFNLFDYFGAVVTDKPDIKTVKDLAGHKLVAAAATTNFAMFKWLAQAQGLDLTKLAVQNTATPGLIGYALADRADAVQLWEPAYSILLAKKPQMRTLDLNIKNHWQQFAGTADIPYLGVAAHEGWIKQHTALVPKLYAAYQQAAEWVAKNPAAAAKLIASTMKNSDVAVLEKLIRNNDLLGMNVKPAAAMRKGIESVYAAGLQSHYLDKKVDPATIYTGKLD
ncbi:MAG TPA: ABC transporter substrate-binding protein [Burkholderiales bacterium]|nr:ABC transporter substrate-binding protein [Burkholderiales bacterium]